MAPSPPEHTGPVTDSDLSAFEAWVAAHGGGRVLRGGRDLERFYPHDDPALGVAALDVLPPGEDPTGEMGPEKVAWRHRGRYQVCNLIYRGRVLELAAGCGHGHALIAASPWVSEVVSLEADYHSCLYGYKHFRHPQKGTFVCGRVPQNLPAGPFDTIVMIELFEHLTRADQETLTPLLHSLLNPGGQLIVTTPYAAADGPNPHNPYHLYERTETSFVGHFVDVFGQGNVMSFLMGRQRFTEGTVHGLGFVVAEKG